MADNSLNVDQPLWFTSRGPPRSYPFKKLKTPDKVLTPEQNDEAFLYRERIRRQDIRYLAEHPEIRAITAMLIDLALQKRPTSPVIGFYADFFSQPRSHIEKTLIPYLENRCSIKKEAIKDLFVDKIQEAPSEISIDNIGKPIEDEDEEETERRLQEIKKRLQVSLTLERPSFIKREAEGDKSVSKASSIGNVSRQSVGSAKVGKTVSATSLVFSPSIEDLLISMHYEKSEDINMEERRRFKSKIGNQNVVYVKPSKDITVEAPSESATMDRKTRLKTLRGGVSTRPKRLKVLKEKTGAYTVVEVEDVEV